MPEGLCVSAANCEFATPAYADRKRGTLYVTIPTGGQVDSAYGLSWESDNTNLQKN